MPLTIVASEFNSSRIRNSYNRIVGACDAESRIVVEAMPLIIADDTNADGVYSDAPYHFFRKVYSEGYGAVKGSIRTRDGRFHLVVMNFSRIDRNTLTDAELDGVLAHELGHIFNRVGDLAELPTGTHADEIKVAKNAWLLDNECYADHFAKKVNCREGLLSSFDKYMQDNDNKNREMFEERSRRLNSEVVYAGGLMEIRNN